VTAVDLAAARAARPGLAWAEVGPEADDTPLPPPGLPLGPLRRALRRAERPVILVNDASRPTPAHLPDVLAELWALSGRRAELVVATGTHRGDLARERDRLGGLPVALHDADDAAAHVELDGWAFDRRVAAADLVVALGSVEPHYFAGWSGAHKTATVGVWDRATTERNHRLALEPGARPRALEGNPLHEDLAAAADRLAADRRLLCVDQVLDAAGRPVAARAGTWRGALERCRPAARARFVRPVPAPVDVLVAAVAGPLGETLYQADKGVKNTEAAVRDGGELVLVAPCGGGAGPDRFLELLRAAPDLAAARAHVAERGYALGDHKAVRWRALEARGVQVRIVAPGLDPAAVAGTGLALYADVGAGLAAGEARGEAGLVVQDAGLVVTELP